MPRSLLIIEDKLLADELDRHFKREGWDVGNATTLTQARRKLIDDCLNPLVTLADMSLPDGNSLDL
jgi:two-component system response regulator AtoC